MMETDADCPDNSMGAVAGCRETMMKVSSPGTAASARKMMAPAQEMAAPGGPSSGCPLSWGLLPRDRVVVVLMRHAARNEPVDGGDVPADMPITDSGRSLAKQLGAMLADDLRSLHCSPVLRCRQTVDAIREGTRRQDIPLGIDDDHLGAPGVFIIDEAVAGRNWAHLGVAGVNRHFMEGEGTLPGMADPGEAVPRLVRHMIGQAGAQAGLHVFVTHDYLLGAVARHCLGRKLTQASWPGYLDWIALWRDDGGIRFCYQGERGIVAWEGGGADGVKEGC